MALFCLSASSMAPTTVSAQICRCWCGVSQMARAGIPLDGDDWLDKNLSIPDWPTFHLASACAPDSFMMRCQTNWGAFAIVPDTKPEWQNRRRQMLFRRPDDGFERDKSSGPVIGNVVSRPAMIFRMLNHQLKLCLYPPSTMRHAIISCVSEIFQPFLERLKDLIWLFFNFFLAVDISSIFCKLQMS